MTRPINAGMLAAIGSERSEMVHLFEFHFAAGIVRISTSAQTLFWNAVEWEAVGGALIFGGVQEIADAGSQGVDISLSGVDQSILAILLESAYRGRPVKLYRAHFNQDTGAVIDAPLLLFQGLQLSPYTVTEQRSSRTGGTVTIKTRLIGYFGTPRVRGIVANLTSHQHYFAGDMFFQHTGILTNNKLYWGQTVPRVAHKTGG